MAASLISHLISVVLNSHAMSSEFS